MKARYTQYAAVVALSSSFSACGPSKEVMCKTIAANRSTPADSRVDEVERYVRCLNASDDYVEKQYKEIMTREQNK